MPIYRDKFSRQGGLVRDRRLNQAATKMHLINHRLEDSWKTQRNENNIMLGTARANNPTHLNQVEQPVIDAIDNHSSEHNDRYQTAMANATKTTDHATKTKKILFWAAKPHRHAVRHNRLLPVFLAKGNAANGVRANQGHHTDTAGYALKVNAGTAAANFRHLWLEYRVQANYGGLPNYVDNNITHEKQQNLNNHGNKKQKIAQKINQFENNWALRAFPEDFTCRARYYSATYNLWSGIYRRETENHTIDSAL
jgi:hypothetical protein